MAVKPAAFDFDVYNSQGDKLAVSVATIGTKFTVSVICERCKQDGLKAFIVNAADENLARAVRFIMSDYGRHCEKVHR